MATGRVLTRDELSSIPNLFLLTPDNKSFIQGKTDLLGGGWTGLVPLLLGIGIVFMPLCICVPYLTTDKAEKNALINLIFIIGLGLLLGVMYLKWRFKRDDEFVQNGKLIPGQITGAWGESKINIFNWLIFLFNLLTIFNGTWSERATYEVKIEYIALSPSGKQIKGETKVRRNDLQNNLPLPGTPIALLYLADDKLRVL